MSDLVGVACHSPQPTLVRRGLAMLVAALAVIQVPSPAQAAERAASTGSAQAFPNKPIRLVVPFSPGGGTDTLARIIAQRMSETWGQSVVIENRTGAGGTIGAAIVAKATPDGHTLLVSSPGFAISAALHPNLPYDPLKDFVGVTQLGFSKSTLVVPPTLGVKSVKDFIEYARARPGKIFFSSGGAGSSTHINGERFRLATGIKAVHVAFKGSSDAALEVIAGRVHYVITGLITATASGMEPQYPVSQ